MVFAAPGAVSSCLLSFRKRNKCSSGWFASFGLWNQQVASTAVVALAGLQSSADVICSDHWKFPYKSKCLLGMNQMPDLLGKFWPWESFSITLALVSYPNAWEKLLNGEGWHFQKASMVGSLSVRFASETVETFATKRKTLHPVDQSALKAGVQMSFESIWRSLHYPKSSQIHSAGKK